MGKSGMNEIEEDTTRGDETEAMKVQEHGEKNKRMRKLWQSTNIPIR